MYLSYVLYTKIHINTILKISSQNGGNIIFYRNFLEKKDDYHYKKKNNVYIIFTNYNTLDILNVQFKNKVNIFKYDVSKLKFLNPLDIINFKIFKYETKNDELEIDHKNNKLFFNSLKSLIEDQIVRILKKICTKYIPIKTELETFDHFINLNIQFSKEIKIKYKYIIYLILKNTLLTFFISNGGPNESYSFVLIH